MTTTQGVDISTWQETSAIPGEINFLKMRSAARFVFIKSSQNTYTDPDFAKNWSSSKHVGLLRGAYHYMDWSKSAVLQANYFVSLLRSDPGELPPVIDYEERNGVPPRSVAITALKTFCDIVEHEIRKPIIYTSPGYWAEYGDQNPIWAKFPLWIAHYEVIRPSVPAPWAGWAFWQYSAKGDGLSFGVESKQIDLDYFNGSEADLLIFAGAKPQPLTWEQSITAWARTMGYNGIGPEGST